MHSRFRDSFCTYRVLQLRPYKIIKKPNDQMFIVLTQPRPSLGLALPGKKVSVLLFFLTV